MYSNIQKMFKDTKKYLESENKNCIKRNKKTSIFDAVAYRFLYTEKSKSQNVVTATINNFLKRKANRSSYVDRDKQVGISIYENIYKIISDSINKATIKNKYTKQIISVDGTHTNMNKLLSKCGFKLNRNQLTCTPLISGLYNVTYNYPVTLDLVTHTNERKAFMDLNKTDLIKNSIFVFDRGYYDSSFFNQLTIMNIEFICRIKSNSSLIDHNKTDHMTTYKIDGNNNIRIITYTINNNNYYIATNLFDTDAYDIPKIKQLYFDRWSVEEYFKFLKTHFNTSKMPRKVLKEFKKLSYVLSL